MISRTNLNRIDFLGVSLLLLASLSLTAGFEEAGARFPWRSSYVISLLTVSGVLWIFTLAWEWHVTEHSERREPVLPWRFITDRTMIGLLL
jgi:hypothetical protein